MSRQSMLLSVLAAVLVVVLWWLFAWSPGQEELASFEADIDAAQTEQSSLEQRVAALEDVRARAPEVEAAIARVQSIVPVDPALAAALRQIAAAAGDAGVSIDALTTARPEGEEDPAIDLYTQSISLAASGSYFQIVDFLRRVEDPAITSRGIVFDSLSMAVAEYPTLTVSMEGRMFSVLEPTPVPAGEAEVEEAPAEADADADETAEGETS